MQAAVMPRGPLSVPPLPAPPVLTWRVPGSKSITSRALVLAALSDGRSVLGRVLDSDDTRHLRVALERLGIAVRPLAPAGAGGEAREPVWEVDGGRGRLRAPEGPLFVGNSGTAARFLTALACLAPGRVDVVGDAAMARRPIRDLVDGLAQLGVAIECPSGCPPVVVLGGDGRLRGGSVRMRGDSSSQYVSAILMAAGLADGDVRLEIEGPLVSRPYVEMTRRMIAGFGGRVEDLPPGAGNGFVVRALAGGPGAPAGYRARRYEVEPDASSAGYAFAAAAATGGRITVPDLGTDSIQGDYAFVDLLERAGARVERSARSSTVTGTASLHGLEADMRDMSDAVMTLAALAVLAEAPTTIRNVGNIRIKETDRLAATVAELRRLGQAVTSGDDWLRIEPRPVTPAVVRCYGDHRMAMSFAVLGLARAGVTIEDPSCVSKTYPGFWADLAACYRAAGAAPPW